jgi:hypothetical protein
MCFFMSLIPATIIVVIGYFVLFSSQKAEGCIRRFGRVLAIWIFVVALFPLIGGAFVTLTDQCPIAAAMHDNG